MLCSLPYYAAVGAFTILCMQPDFDDMQVLDAYMSPSGILFT